MNKEFEEKLGHLSYTLIRRESTLNFIFPFYDGIIFVIADKEIPIQDIEGKISELITRFDSGMQKLR